MENSIKSTVQKQKKGFTLAEVLITLGIIGVVSAMTIPALMNNIRAVRLRSQFNKARAEIQLAFKTMADNESVAPGDYYNTSVSGNFYKRYMRYFNSPTDCGTNSSGQSKNLPCYHKTAGRAYKTLDGRTNFEANYIDDGQIGLMDGVLILIENYQDRLYISTDINGYNNGPNQAGIDLFTFEVIDSGLVPMGNEKTKYNDMDKYCNPITSSGNLNGIACAEKAVKDPQYFKNLYKQAVIK